MRNSMKKFKKTIKLILLFMIVITQMQSVRIVKAENKQQAEQANIYSDEDKNLYGRQTSDENIESDGDNNLDSSVTTYVTDKNLLANVDDMYLYTDVRFQITDGQEQVRYVIDINKAREQLSSYTLVSEFDGNYSKYSVQVYLINSDGSSSGPLEEEVDYNYDSATGTVSFNDINACYAVVYVVDTTVSFKEANMSAGTGVSVSGTFTASIATADDSKTLKETRVFEPITANENNKNLKNSTILTNYETQVNGNEVEVTFDWSIDNGLVDSDGKEIKLDVHAGSYFVFKLESDDIDIYNDYSGVLSQLYDNSEVGVFYMYEDGTIIFVFNRFTEEKENTDGQFTVTSGFTGDDGDEVYINIEINGELDPGGQESEDYGLSKFGEIIDSHHILWNVIVNTEKNNLKNLVITDTEVSGQTGWLFDSNGVVVYELDENNQKKARLIEDKDYTATLSNGKWTINLGDTSKTFLIEFKATTNDSEYWLLDRTYTNTVYSNATDYSQLEAEAEVTKTMADSDKVYTTTIDEENETATVGWTVDYNSNYLARSVDSVVITDQFSTPYWYTTSGSSLDEIVKLDNISYSDMKNFKVTIQASDDAKKITLDEDDDYILEVTKDDKGIQTGFTLTFNKTNKTANENGDIAGKITISYAIDLDLKNRPDGASGWNFRNTMYTDEDRYTSNDAYAKTIEKEARSINYNSNYVDWTIEINKTGETIEPGTKIYDVLPAGFTIIPNSVEIIEEKSDDTTSPVEVVDNPSSATDSQYFLYNDNATTTTIGDGQISISYGDKEGFSLTYENSTSTRSSFTIKYKTYYNYDPNQIGENKEGYVNSYINTNTTYLVIMENRYYKSDADVQLPDDYDTGGEKYGVYLPGTTNKDGVIESSKIYWYVYANSLNFDISGGRFTDELLNGMTASDGTEIETSVQTVTLDDIYIYPYIITSEDGDIEVDYSNTNLLDYLKNNNCINVVDNKITIEFPEGYQQDLVKLGIVTDIADDANMRFVVIIASTLVGDLAPYYPNTAVLDYPNRESDEWFASVSVDNAKNPISKQGDIINENSVNYSVVFNKDLKKLQKLVISDSMMYDSETGEQLIFLESDDSNPNGYKFNLYYAIVSLDDEGNLVYTKGEKIRNSNYSIEYNPNNRESQGFKVELDDDFVIENVPIIMEYSCVLLENYFKVGYIITNSVKIEDMAGYDDGWKEGYYYTTASGSTRGEVIEFSLQKVYVDKDANQHTLSGATFQLYNSNKRYIAKQGEVDQEGTLLFNNITTGIYYLVEIPPEGYATDFDSISNALELIVTKSDEGEVIVSARTSEGIMQISEDGWITIVNERVTGFFQLVKYKNDVEGNATEDPLSDAQFVLYQLDGEDKLYYTSKDNGIMRFASTKQEDAVLLTTNDEGIIDEDGILFGTYYIEEVAAPIGYEVIEEPQEIIISTNEEITITLYDDVTLTDIRGSKTWDDKGYEENRPESIMVNLYRNDSDEIIASQKVIADESGNWEYVFSDLPRYDSNENEYIYRIGEVEVEGYETAINGYDITNSYTEDIPDTITIKGSKTWNDKGHEENRPESIMVNLYRNDSDKIIASQKVIADESGNWEYVFSDLPRYDGNENEYIYRIGEVEVEGYETAINGFNITNSYTEDIPDTITIRGSKSWIDEGHEENRPDSITVNLYRNDSDEIIASQKVVADESGNWGYVFTDLSQYDSNENEYIYRIGEVEVEGYETAINGYDITNSYTEDIPDTITIRGSKTWDDKGYEENRPESITVNLYRNDSDEIIASQKVVADESGNWGYVFTDLPQYDSNENEYIYRIGEVEVEGYETAINGFNITNSYTEDIPDTITIRGSKSWIDEGHEENRPDSITVNLYRNDSDEIIASQKVVADESGNWGYVFTDLPQYDSNENEYIYRIGEVEVEGYETAINGYDITNSYTEDIPDTITIRGSKTWDDKGYEENRPESITVNLYRNDSDEIIASQKVVADESGNWGYVFTDLPQYDSNENEYIYRIGEVEVEGYETSIDGFNITNTYTPTSTTNNNTTNNNTTNNNNKVITGDSTNTTLLWLLVLFATNAIVLLIILKKRKQMKC